MYAIAKFLWVQMKDLGCLHNEVYEYTLKILDYLKQATFYLEGTTDLCYEYILKNCEVILR